MLLFLLLLFLLLLYVIIDCFVCYDWCCCLLILLLLYVIIDVFVCYYCWCWRLLLLLLFVTIPFVKCYYCWMLLVLLLYVMNDVVVYYYCFCCCYYCCCCVLLLLLWQISIAVVSFINAVVLCYCCCKLLFLLLYNRICGVMVGVLTTSTVDCGFEPLSCQHKDYKIGTFWFSANNAALRRKSKYWLAWNQDNVSEWSNMSIRGLLFQWASTIKIQLRV
jgi:hypothetical protein